MACEQFKKTDYTAEAVECRKKAAKAAKENVDINTKRYDEYKKEYDSHLTQLEKDENGKIIPNATNNYFLNRLKNLETLLKAPEEVINTDIDKKNAQSIPTVEAWNKETEEILNANPNASEEIKNRIINRPGGPTKEQLTYATGKEEYLNKIKSEELKLTDPGGTTSEFVSNLLKENLPEAFRGLEMIGVSSSDDSKIVEAEEKKRKEIVKTNRAKANKLLSKKLKALKNKDTKLGKEIQLEIDALSANDFLGEDFVKSDTTSDDIFGTSGQTTIQNTINFLEKEKKKLSFNQNNEATQIDEEIARLKFSLQNEPERERSIEGEHYLKIKNSVKDYNKAGRRAIENDPNLTDLEKAIRLAKIDEEALVDLSKHDRELYTQKKELINEVVNVNQNNSWTINNSLFKSVENTLGIEKGKYVTDEVEAEILNILTEPTGELFGEGSAKKQFIAEGKFLGTKWESRFGSLQDKEQILTQARGNVLSKVYNEEEAEYSDAMRLFYNYKDLKDVPQSAIDNLNTTIKNSQNNILKVNEALGYNKGTKAFLDSFEMSEEFQEWLDKHIDGGKGGEIADGMGTLIAGGGDIAFQYTVGSSKWFGADIGGDIGEEVIRKITGDNKFFLPNQDYLDAMFDAFADSNIFGLSDKGGSFTEGFTEDMDASAKLAQSWKNISFRSLTKTITKMAPFTLGIILQARKGNFTTMNKAYSVLQGMGASEKLIRNIKMGQFAFRATVGDNQREAEELGLTGPSAYFYAAGTSMATAVVQGIMPDANFFSTAAGQTAKNSLAQSLKGLANISGAKAVVKKWINNLAGELGEEELELVMQDAMKVITGLSNERKFFDLDTQIETIYGTIALTSGTSAISAPKLYSNTKKQVYNEFRKDANGMLNTLKDAKELTKLKLKEAKKLGDKKAISNAELELVQIEDAANYGMDLVKAINVASDITNNEQIDLLREKINLIKQKDKLDPAAAAEIDAKIKELDIKINESAVAKQSDVIEERTLKNVKKLAGDLGVGFKNVKNSDDALKIIEEENKKIKEQNKGKDPKDQQPLINIKDSTGNGFIVQNPDGTQRIYINKEVAGNNKAVTTAQHELLHAVLLQTITKNPKAISAMANGLRQEIDNMVQTDVSFNNSYIQQKLDAYKNKPDSIKDEELLTIFSEGMTEGYIKYEEGLFTSLGDVARRAMSALGVRVTFKTGKDVYNFIKDFNKSVEKGKFSKGLKRTVTEGAKVKMAKESAFNYNPTREAKTQSLYNNDDKNISRRSYNIAQSYAPIVQALVNKGRESTIATGVDWQVIDDLTINHENPGSVFNTVMNYDPASGISLDETIGKTLRGELEPIMKATSKASAQVGDIKSNLDIFVQEETTGDRKYDNKTDFQRSEDFSEAFNTIENTKLLDGLIKRGVSDAYLEMNPDFIQDVKRRIGDKFANEFDPAKNESLFGWLTGTTRGGQSIINFAKGDIQNKNKANIDTTSIDTGTRQIADISETSNEVIQNKKLLNPESILPDTDTTNKFLEDTKKDLSKMSTGDLIDIRYKTSESIAKKAFAKIFGIPASRIFNKTDNLRKGEAKEIQRFILKNAAKLIRLLPEGNAPVRTALSKTGKGTVKRGGESVGLPRTLQNLFYTQLKTAEGKPKKIDSEGGKQSIQYRKNPGITQTQFLEAFGIVDGKINPNFKPRSGQAQAIKGLMEIVARNVTNLAARQELDTRKDIAENERLSVINKMGEGKARAMASHGTKIDPFNLQISLGKQLRESLAEFEVASQMTFGDLSKTEKIKYKKLVKRYQEEYLGKPKWISENEAMAELKSEQRIKPTPKFIKARNKWLNDIAPLVDISFIQAEVIAKSRRGMFRNMKEVYKALGVKNKEEAISKFGKDKLKLPTKLNYSGENIKTAADFRKLIKTKAFKDNEALKMPYLKSIASAMELDLSNNPENLAIWESFLYDSGHNTTSIIRRTAPIKFFSIIDGKEIVEEHSMPANNVAKFLLLSAFTGKVDQNFGLIENNYFQGALRKEDDLKLRGPGFNYIANMPAAFFTMENLTTWVRYNNENVAKIKGGIDFSTYEMLDGKTVATTLVNQGMAIVEANIKAENVITKGQEVTSKQSKSVKITPDQLSADVNNMIEKTLGIGAKKRYSDIVAKRKGSGIKHFRLISPGAQDFSGLMYDLYSKGKLGEQQQKWVKDNLITPYQKGIANIDKYRQALKNDYAALLKKFPNVAKKLSKKVPGTDFTYDQALRVNLWTRGGYEIPGISKRDAKKLNDAVGKDPELNLFNDAALLVSKEAKWVAPSAHWDVESLISDLNNLTNKVGRKKFLAEFIENSNAIFSKENLNKMEVALGTNWREAMEDSLYRMTNGTNRPSGTNRLTNNFNNWVNNSVGAIMFFNMKSALLQTISAVNFLNWSDNNPFKAALAFGNQPQFWSDFATLWNSPKLKQRRSGLRKDVNEAELANAVRSSTNKASAALSYLLKLGFTPTQLADSFAIASGGATFYRNRLETYKKQGMSEKEATDKAFEDFAEASDVAQQSADPMLISQQQASILGRLLLAFQNTPAQVTRIFNKAARDFINNRGDQKTNVSKMIYYGAIQGFIFAALQNALFAMIPGFDDEDDEEKKASNLNKKEERIVNSMVDTLLRGSGVYGAIIATLKNTALTYFREEKKDAFGKDHRNTLVEIMNLSPPVGSKLRKVNNAIKAQEYNEEVVEEQGWDVTLKGKVNLSPSYQVLASLTEAFTNLPLERMVIEIDRIVETLDARNTTFQRIALALGYRTWDVGAKNEERDLVKIEVKERKKQEKKEAKEKEKERLRKLEEERKYLGKTEEEIKIIKQKDSIFDTNKSAQIISLTNLGLTKKEIRELKLEEERVDKILELTN